MMKGLWKCKTLIIEKLNDCLVLIVSKKCLITVIEAMEDQRWLKVKEMTR